MRRLLQHLGLVSKPVPSPPAWRQDEAFWTMLKKHKLGDANLYTYGAAYVYRNQVIVPDSLLALAQNRIECRYQGWCGARDQPPVTEGASPYRQADESITEFAWAGSAFWAWAMIAFPHDTAFVPYPIDEQDVTYYQAYSRMRRRAQGWLWYTQQP